MKVFKLYVYDCCWQERVNEICYIGELDNEQLELMFWGSKDYLVHARSCSRSRRAPIDFTN